MMSVGLIIVGIFIRLSLIYRVIHKKGLGLGVQFIMVLCKLADIRRSLLMMATENIPSGYIKKLYHTIIPLKNLYYTIEQTKNKNKNSETHTK